MRHYVESMPGDWDRVGEVFLAAIELSGTARELYLARECAGDASLRAEVESLIAAEEGGRGALTGAIEEAAESLGEENLSGQVLGPWRVDRQIGQGGMGTVYRGFRADAQFEKRVAIKILRRGMESARLLTRFRHERQILAQLSHPGIAQLLDGGSTADGRPYLVMEFVDGIPLDHFCEETKPTVAERCRLFSRICEAVSYAHRNLVVHRDLKPSNILVTPEGTPRLLDFGIAKLLSRDGTEEALTSAMERTLTPDYASPEEILGERVTTTSDVYSLGAILFQILTGAKPRKLQTYTPEEVRRVAVESLPQRPSNAAGAGGGELAGDLDNIVLMAMRKEPERRYASVDELRQDVERYLDGRPVLAREDTFGYRASKFLRRNRVAVVAAAIVLVSIIGGGVVALHEADVAAGHRDIAERERDAARRALARAEQEHTVAQQQRDRAESQSARAQKRLDELVELANRTLLNIHDQLERLPGATEPRKAIVGTTLEYLDSLLGDASTDRDLALVVASGYIKMGDLLGSPLNPNLGDTPGALKSYNKALAVLKPRDGFGATLRKFTALEHIGSLHQEAGKLKDAGAAYRGAMMVAQQIEPANREDETYLNEMANLHMEYSRLQAKLSDKEGAEDARKSVAIREKLVARYPRKEEYAQALAADYGNLSLLLMTSGRREEARIVAAKTIEVRERNAQRHPEDVLLKRDLMMGYGRMGDLTGGPFFGRKEGGDDKGALEFYKKAVDVAAWVMKADANNQLAGADYATALMRAGMVLPDKESLTASIGYLNQAANIFGEILKKNPKLRFARANFGLSNEHLARRYDALGQLPEAIEHARTALAVAEGMVADEPQYASARINAMLAWDELVHVLARSGRRAEVLAELERAVRTAEDYAAHGPKPERMKLYPPEVRGWIGDVHTIFARQGGGPGEWREARAAYAASAEGWKRLAVEESATRLTALEGKLSEVDRELSVLGRK